MSFLEMLDVLNETARSPRGRSRSCLRARLPRGHLRFLRDDDQRHPPRSRRRAPRHASCTCAALRDGQEIYIEPWRAKAFPVVKDLVVDRSSLDRVVQAGAYVSVNDRRRAQDANAIPVDKVDADRSL